jgi:phospholipid/cholesterol/gamma-HCH transport system permease protein
MLGVLKPIIEFIAEIGRIALFLLTALRQVFTRRPVYEETLRQAWFVGVETMPMVIVIATFIGTNLALQGYHAFAQISGQSLVGIFVALAGFREMAPIVAGICLATKVGASIASEIAVMRIKEQIDAMEVMAVNPYWFIIAPRFLAIIFCAPFLILFANFFCMLSGYIVAVYQLGIDPTTYLTTATTQLEVLDIGYSIIKGCVFGLVICLLSCYYGFNAGMGAEGVGAASNRAIVTSCLTCFVANVYMTQVMYG